MLFCCNGRSRRNLREKFDLANAAQTVGLIILLYVAAPEKFNKRVSSFLQFGGMCTAITKKSGPLKTRFVDKLNLVAHIIRIDVQLSLTDKKPVPIPRKHPSFDGASQKDIKIIECIGQMVTNRLCNQLDYINVDSPFTFVP